MNSMIRSKFAVTASTKYEPAKEKSNQKNSDFTSAFLKTLQVVFEERRTNVVSFLSFFDLMLKYLPQNASKPDFGYLDKERVPFCDQGIPMLVKSEDDLFVECNMEEIQRINKELKEKVGGRKIQEIKDRIKSSYSDDLLRGIAFKQEFLTIAMIDEKSRRISPHQEDLKKMTLLEFKTMVITVSGRQGVGKSTLQRTFSGFLSAQCVESFTVNNKATHCTKNVDLLLCKDVSLLDTRGEGKGSQNGKGDIAMRRVISAVTNVHIFCCKDNLLDCDVESLKHLALCVRENRIELPNASKPQLIILLRREVGEESAEQIFNESFNQEDKEGFSQIKETFAGITCFLVDDIQQKHFLMENNFHPKEVPEYYGVAKEIWRQVVETRRRWKEADLLSANEISSVILEACKKANEENIQPNSIVVQIVSARVRKWMESKVEAVRKEMGEQALDIHILDKLKRREEEVVEDMHSQFASFKGHEGVLKECEKALRERISSELKSSLIEKISDKQNWIPSTETRSDVKVEIKDEPGEWKDL